MPSTQAAAREGRTEPPARQSPTPRSNREKNLMTSSPDLTPATALTQRPATTQHQTPT
jgi:hypothetical protein